MKGGSGVYENLKAEMARKSLTKRDIADGLGKDRETAFEKGRKNRPLEKRGSIEI